MPDLLFESGAFEGTATYEWCPCDALKHVPDPVMESARAIAVYRRTADRDKASTSGGDGPCERCGHMATAHGDGGCDAQLEMSHSSRPCPCSLTNWQISGDGR